MTPLPCNFSGWSPRPILFSGPIWFVRWGALATGLFIADFALPEGVSWGAQIWIQLKSIGFTVVFAPIATGVILLVLRTIFGDLRASDEGEAQGLDLSEHSESAYAVSA